MRDVIMNNKTNLLQLEEHFYQLADVSEPNTFRNLFPYSEIPKIAFNDRIVPHNMPEDIWITDTTFRDGQQSRAPYTTEQILSAVKDENIHDTILFYPCTKKGCGTGHLRRCLGAAIETGGFVYISDQSDLSEKDEIIKYYYTPPICKNKYK